MHPVLAQGRWLALYLVAVLSAGGAAAAVLAATAAVPLALAATLLVPLAVVHGFGCLASWYVCRSLPLAANRPGRLLAGHLAAAALTVGSVAVLGHGWAGVLALRPGLAAAPGAFVAALPALAAAAFLTYSLAAAVHYLLLAVAASRQAEARAVELRVLAQEAELRALRAQVDPHFLFNALGSISGLVTTQPAEARRMCALLAELLRESLRTGRRDMIPLGEELALVERYLAIEAIRFGARLRVATRVAEGCREVPVPPLLLQPLVENAVRHGIAHLVEGGEVTLVVERDGDRVTVTVTNPCDPDRPRPRRRGIGLDNVRRRLAARFGRRGGLEVRDEPERHVATVTLPAGEAPDAEGER